MKLLSDTSAEARARVIDHWRGIPPEEKLAAVGRMNRAALSLAQARQDAWYPDATPEERRLRLASLWVDPDAMIRWWGWDPRVRAGERRSPRDRDRARTGDRGRRRPMGDRRIGRAQRARDPADDAGDRPRRVRDVLGIVAPQRGRLDLDHLQRWARELDVADLLDRALADETGGL